MADSWSASSNSATSLKLVGPSSPSTGAFNPDFTYPIFGEAETIYGYKGLDIKLKFASGDLTTYLKVDYKEKNEGTTAKIDNVEASLKQFLPGDYLTDETAFQDAVLSQETSFRPLGEKVHSYTRSKSSSKGKGRAGKVGSAGDSLAEDDSNARVFEIYRSTWETRGFRELHRRMQIFALFFIEGASYIQEDEQNWEFFCLYERVPRGTGDEDGQTSFSWHFAGYTSLYRFWCWPDAARVRLSQFVILPPFQKQGHGGALYSQVHDEMLKRPSVTEMTVEDPSEAFDRLRDGSDLRRLLAPGGFVDGAKAEGKLRAPLDVKWSESERLKRKIAPRQWSRLVEMLQLMDLRPDEADQVKAYRLQVKARLFRFNKDILTQLKKSERVVKLQETFESVVDEYGELVGVDVEPLLEAAEMGNSGADVGGSSGANGGHADGPPRKMARLD
ncbi:histone acetyltransferase type B [Violaceomyces palustris]|uniref:Histone acetyltransferase type B n=1 Tax=Violaceomyces palustris TaxID=1673888 RepID=A0ACD0P1V1_9BASI|nr:histone acetyltransferase type B [Violaceomyces palustris]